MLAATIEQTLERVSAFIARERYFTGSASHELRTPITVIKGALELLEHSDLTAADTKVLARVRRATQEMQTTIEMFLCLAREADDGLYEEDIAVMPMVVQAVEQQRHLLNGKQVQVTVKEGAMPKVSGHPQAFSIAVNNLVRNAFEHAIEGQDAISIQLNEQELLITNQVGYHKSNTMTKTEAPQGYGLGLGIVQRLCERNGWSFVMDVDEAWVVARLSW